MSSQTRDDIVGMLRRYETEGGLPDEAKVQLASLLCDNGSVEPEWSAARDFLVEESDFLYQHLGDDARWLRLCQLVLDAQQPTAGSREVASDEQSGERVSRIQGLVLESLRQSREAGSVAQAEAGLFKRLAAALHQSHLQLPLAFLLGGILVFWAGGPEPDYGVKGVPQSFQESFGPRMVAVEPGRGDASRYRAGDRFVLNLYASERSSLTLIDFGTSGRASIAATFDTTGSRFSQFPETGSASVSGPPGQEWFLVLATSSPPSQVLLAQLRSMLERPIRPAGYVWVQDDLARVARQFQMAASQSGLSVVTTAACHFFVE